MRRILRIGLAQIATRLGDVEGNKKKIMDAIKRGREEKVQIILTPELATLGFGSGDIYLDKVEENLRALDEIREVSKENHVWIVVGYVEKDSLGFYYNSAALLGEGKVQGNFRKIQLVNYRLFDEKRYFKPGSELPVFETPFGRIGILICEDVWFPEPARALTFRGAEILLVLSASPFDRGKVELWEDYLKVRVYDNILPLAFSNQAGVQDGVTYWGGSMVFNARGEIIARAKLLEEDFLVAEIDLEESKRLRRRDIRVREVRREILNELIRAFEESE
jgi:NAD+ synthase (glutamine-hydrolysing)